MTSLEQTGARFDTTEWTLLEAAGGAGDAEEVQRALSALVERYWPAVYAALRRWGKSREEAAELTQAFFVEVVLQRRLFERAEEGRGRLRTLVLAALKRFLVDKHRRGKVRGSQVTISLDSLQREEEILAGQGPTSPADAFERRWALAALQAALTRCQEHFRGLGKAAHWEVFEARVVQPTLTGSAAPMLNKIHASHGFANAPAAAAAIQVVKKRVLALLSEIAAETVENEAEADEEYALLLRWLGG